jgi:hypothetical protein
MTPKTLQGLNLVVQPTTTETSDESDILLSKNHFSDLTAQLDLWTNLAFESDDPLKSPPSSEPNPISPVDFLAGFGIDSFPAPDVQSPALINSSLAQLLALHPFPTTPFTSVGGPNSVPLQPPPPSPQQQQQQQTDNAFQPQNKRPRTRKSSSSSTIDEPGDSTTTNANTALSIAEDKRRRNTAASARFRLKKKEREAALETRAKELEMKVNELERECEGLRRENGWLKGLVVGVTGASANANAAAATTGVKRPRDDHEETNR